MSTQTIEHHDIVPAVSLVGTDDPANAKGSDLTDQPRDAGLSQEDALRPVFEAIQPANVPHLSSSKRTLIASFLVVANLVQFLSAMTTIGGGLFLSKLLGRGSSPGQANWMAASYSLTQGAFVLITGRLGAIYGHQRLTLIGLFLFALFSLITGFCRSYSSFIALRALTGIGGGIFMPNAVSILTLMVPPGRARNVLLGFFAASPPIGGAIGVLLAGLCAESQDWVNWTGLFGGIAGAAAMCFIVLIFTMPKESVVDNEGTIDYTGAFLGLSSLLLYNIAWNQAPSVGWAAPSEISILVTSVALFVSFLVWERNYAREPIMPLGIFKAPTFLALILVVLLSFMSFGTVLWYSITWQQSLRNISVFQTGINMLPFTFGSVLSVGVGAYLLPRVAAQWIMAAGVAVVLVGSLLLATMPATQSYWLGVFPSMLVCSFCPDFVYLAAQVIASNSVSRKHQGAASSLVGTLNLYGNSLGLGFAGTIENEVTKRLAGGSHGAKTTFDIVSGYRGALYFAAGIAGVGLVLDFAFVRVPKDEREGWDEEVPNGSGPPSQSGIEMGAVSTAVDRAAT